MTKLPPVLLFLALGGSSALAQPSTIRTLSLDEALQELDRQSLTMAQARARAEEAAGLAQQALAPALPTLGASASYTRNSEAAQVRLGDLLAPILPPGAPTPPRLVIQPLESFASSATLRVPLVAPSAWAEAAAARRLARSADGASDTARLHARGLLRQAAWSAAAAEEIVSATERALASAEEQARLADRALAAGTSVPLTVLQARTESVKRRSDLVRVRAELERARLAVGVLLGRAQPVRITLAPATPPPTIDPRALAQEALGRRPELRSTAERVQADERQVDAALCRLLPHLSASASGFAQDDPFPTGDKVGWRLMAELNWSLYDGGYRYGRAAQARGALSADRAAADAQKLAVSQEVEDAARDAGVASERLGLALEQVKLAGEAAATARRGFAAGISSSLDVLDANDRLYQSEVGLADARARLGIALAVLDRAAGRY